MNQKHMQYVLTVLKEGSFTAAAKKLYVSQPSLSQIIKTAETNLGAPIFDRSTDPITLTPAGQLYVQAARQITDISTNLGKQIEELKNEEFGVLRLGIAVQRAIEILPKVYPVFKERYPHVEIDLHEMGSNSLEQSVLEGTVSMAMLTTSPKHDDLIYELIQKENIVLLVNKNSDLAKRIAPGTPIDISEAKDEVFICSRHGHSARIILDNLLNARRITPTVGLETVSIEVGTHVVATSNVVMACPDVYADTSNSESAPYYSYPVLGVDVPRHFYVCYRKNLYLTNYMRGFLEILHQLPG